MSFKVYIQKSQNLNILYIFIFVKHEHNVTLIPNGKIQIFVYYFNLFIIIFACTEFNRREICAFHVSRHWEETAATLTKTILFYQFIRFDNGFLHINR